MQLKMMLGQGDGLASNGPMAALKYKIKLQFPFLKFGNGVEFNMICGWYCRAQHVPNLIRHFKSPTKLDKPKLNA